MNRVSLLMTTLALFCLTIPPAAPAELTYGARFPEVGLRLPDTPFARNYLGVDDLSAFTLSDIRGDLVLIEFLNVHCPHCQMQAPSYNELFKDIDEFEASRGRIRMLGVAVGNLESEVATFKARYGVKFPVVADRDFTIWRAVYGAATPYSVYVRQTEPGQPGVVAGSHLGLNTHYRQLLAELIRLADLPPREMIAQARQSAATRQAVAELFSEDELAYRVRTAFLGTGGEIRDFGRVMLRSGRRIYAARMQAGETTRTLFAEVVSRPSVCDICHDVHFIYIFDLRGRVFGFDALQLTKYGNVDWNEQEIAAMRGRLLGKSLTRKHPFHPEVDAVSSATITSALIFDSINQGASLLDELREKGY